jgi:uncharacterized protein (DUF1800 family)
MATPTGDVAHLLRRSGFGGSPEQVQALAALDIRAIVDRVLDTSADPPVVMPAIVASSDASSYEQWVAMTQWWLDRMATTPTPLVEKMTLFWHGHLCSAVSKVENRLAMWNQQQLFRTGGLASLRDLVQAVAIDPAMLRYLDNDTNRVGAPNENFARELMELFTLGVDQYTQDDVMASARAWTGYGRDGTTGAFVYRPKLHDVGLKTFFGKTRAWAGPEIIDEILTGSTRDVAARFIATKLWSFFAYPDPEPAVIDAIVAPYVAADLDVRSLVKAIFLRREFYSARSKRGLVRSPIEYMVAAMKGTALPASVAHPEWWCRAMGQVPFDPPNVSGWRPNEYWISSSATWAKIAFADYLRWKANETDLLKNLGSLPPAASVDAALRQFGVDNAGPTTKAAMQHYVERERMTDRWPERPNLLFLTMMCPEMQLA